MILQPGETPPPMLFGSVDYSGIELCTLAQVCLWTVGYSKMADIINETGDPGGLHAAFGANMLGKPVDEFKKLVKSGDRLAKDYRQAAKAANFGFPGGMGAAKLVLAKRKKNEGTTVAPDGTRYAGIRFCVLTGGAEHCGVEKVTEWKGRACPPVCRACCVQAEMLRNRWLDTFPEMRAYFEFVSRVADTSGEVRLAGLPYQKPEHYLKGSLRGGVEFTDGANGHFQELAALLMKDALWRVTRACYVERGSVLYRTTRVPLCVHDEMFVETLAAAAHLTVPEVVRMMEASGRRIVPGVLTKAEPAISRRWLKAMEPYYVDGKLAPWEDGPAGREYLAKKGWQL
jgi:DNA polymerase-1